MWQILIPAVTQLLDKVLPDANAAQEAKTRIIEMQLKGELDQIAGQLQINLEEAKSSNPFVSGWRPAVGWTGAVAFAYVSVLEPFLRFTAQVGFGYTGAFPQIDTDITMQVLMGLLGLAGLRSWDKKNGTASK